MGKITGTSGNDSLNGTVGADEILGLAGDDTLRGDDGNDVLDGGSGADTMYGGRGNDSYYVDTALDTISEEGGDGEDTLFSTRSWILAAGFENLTLLGANSIKATGNDVANILTGNSAFNKMRGMGGDDAIDGRGGDDLIYGGTGKDSVYGGLGLDTLYGESGDDLLDGGAGGDTMYGGLGNDSYYVDTGDDVVSEDGGDGTDTVFSTRSWILGAGFENLTLIGSGNVKATGNEGANVLTGNDRFNKMQGLGGDDTIDGRGGDDLILGGNGADTLNGGEGNDTIDGGTGADTIDGGAGSDSVLYREETGAVVVTLTGATPALVTIGGVAQDTLVRVENVDGGKGDDQLTGDAEINVLRGAEGNDHLTAIGGWDQLYGGLGDDLFTVVDGGGNVFDGGTGYSPGDELDYRNAASAPTTIVVNSTAIAGFSNAQTDRIYGMDKVFLEESTTVDLIFGPAPADRDDNGGFYRTFFIGGDVATVDLSRMDMQIDYSFWENSGLIAKVGRILDLPEIVIGSAFSDLLNNGASTTSITFRGGGGSDSITGGRASGDILEGGTGDDWIASGGGADSLFGQEGNDTLNNTPKDDAGGITYLHGGDGMDTLVGSSSEIEYYVFDTALDAATNVDTITKLRSEDQIVLDDAVFTALSDGALAAGQFRTGSAATDGDDRIIYDRNTGNLYYDADGVGGAAQIHFATLTGSPILTAADFVVV
ncbi:MAG TPA: calcium-binding protein [Allosphingosinicella sp.]|jgi:Ca2+-binding RTX toxin-like protein